MIRKRLILNTTFRSHDKNDILWVGEIFVDDKVYRTKSGNIQYSSQLRNERFLQFSSGGGSWKGKVFMTFSFKPRRSFVAGKRLFRLCGFVVTSYGTSKTFSSSFWNNIHSSTSDVLYIEKVLHEIPLSEKLTKYSCTSLLLAIRFLWLFILRA